MTIDFPCAVHPDARALQIAKCAAFHQLCGLCWTEAYKSGHCAFCQNVLEELMPEPLCEYQIDKFKSAAIFDYRHRLPCELLDEMIKFCPVEYFPRSTFHCRPKNVAFLVANSALRAIMANQLKMKTDFYYFKSTLTTLLTRIGPRFRESIFGLSSTLSEQEFEEIAAKMLRNKGKYMSTKKLLGIGKDEIRAYRLYAIKYVKRQIEEEMKRMKREENEHLMNEE